MSNLLADLVEDQDADADAETGNGYDEETLAFIQQETALRQQVPSHARAVDAACSIQILTTLTRTRTRTHV